MPTALKGLLSSKKAWVLLASIGMLAAYVATGNMPIDEAWGYGNILVLTYLAGQSAQDGLGKLAEAILAKKGR